MIEQTPVLSEIDFVRLNKLVTEKLTEGAGLEDLLEEADIKNLACMHSDLVTMNSKISYLRLSDQKVGELTIVYPEFADLSEHLVSVLSPLGRSFIGRYKGDLVDCPLPTGESIRLRILDILYQPEACGDFHL